MPERPTVHGAAQFISWTWEMINGGFADVSWSSDGSEVVVTNPERMQREVLPQFFRHSQYSSWVRAMNAYQFRKVGPGRWTNPNFKRGKPELLKNITRQAKGGRALAKEAREEAARQSEAEKLPPADVTPAQRETWELLLEERARIEWMRLEMASLESQVREAQREEWEQRVDAVRLGQFVASELRAFAPAPLDTTLASLGSPYLTSTPHGGCHAEACKKLHALLGYEPKPGECEATDAVRGNCGGCHKTALEVRRLCLEYKAASSDHARCCDELCSGPCDEQMALEGHDAEHEAVEGAIPPGLATTFSGAERLAGEMLEQLELSELAGGLDMAALEAEGSEGRAAAPATVA